MLFDGSRMSVADNRAACAEIVAEAHALGAAVEGEIEPIRGVEDGIGSDEPSEAQALDVALDFIRFTGIDCFAPAIGNAHGMYHSEPRLDAERVSAIVAAGAPPHRAPRRQRPHPGAVHGPHRARLREGEHLDRAQDALHRRQPRLDRGPSRQLRPAQLLRYVRAEVIRMAIDHITMFGSAGQAW